MDREAQAGLPVHHQFPELAQTYVHRVSDAILTSHPLLSPSPSDFNLFQHQGLFQFSALEAKSIRVSASASILPMNIQVWFPVGLTGLNSLQSKGLSRVFSNTTVQKHQFFDIQLSLWASLLAQRVKHLPAVWETRVLFLGQEDPLEKEMATHSSTLAWKIPRMGDPGKLQSMELQRVTHDLRNSLLMKQAACHFFLWGHLTVCFS